MAVRFVKRYENKNTNNDVIALLLPVLFYDQYDNPY